jgi:hypothetical protein
MNLLLQELDFDTEYDKNILHSYNTKLFVKNYSDNIVNECMNKITNMYN